MGAGKLDMTVGAIQGSLRQILKNKEISPLLTAEQRYSLTAAVESMEFVKLLSPGLKKAMEEHGTTPRKTTRTSGTSGAKSKRKRK